MSCVTTRFGEAVWSVREPVLTRYLPHTFVDDLFETGRLRLSSFRSFRRHADEARHDDGEGHISMQIAVSNGSVAVAAINGAALYVLCACTIESPRLAARFGSDDGFRILEPLRFADCTSHHIPGFRGGMQGLCTYRATRLVRKTASFVITPPSESEEESWTRRVDQWVGQQSIDALFLKGPEYSDQGEYRFIWHAEGKEQGFLEIEVPEARQYCQRIDPLDGPAAASSALRSPRAAPQGRLL